MAKVTDLLDSLGVAEDGISTVYPETFTDDIRAAYDEDISIPAARIAVLEADLAAAQQEIVLLKAHNYELMVSAPAEGETNEPDPEEGEGDSGDSEERQGVDSLFTDKKEG